LQYRPIKIAAHAVKAVSKRPVEKNLPQSKNCDKNETQNGEADGN
jgi:hypothetical protein